LHYVINGKGVYYTPNGSYIVEKGQIFVIKPNEMTAYQADGDDPWHYYWIGFESSLELSNSLGDGIDQGREFFICGRIYDLLYMLSNKNHPGEKGERYVRMAQGYIHKHYQMPDLRVDALAKSLNLDRAYFSKIFRKHIGKSPQQYIVDYRLEKSVELMTCSDLTPGEAAREVGYGSTLDFSRMFSRHFGMSPSAFCDKYYKKSPKQKNT